MEKTNIEKTNIVVYTTKNYSMFTKLEGNRPVKDNRVDKIVESINKIGYVTSPILVNEKMEIIDGQGRLSALERLKLPVEYIIKPGIGIDECRQMNIHQTNWKNYDYICSYAVLGNDNYARLQSLIDLYDLPEAVVIGVCYADRLQNKGYSGWLNSKVKSGNFILKKSTYDKVKWELDYALKFKTVAKNIGGSKFPFYSAIIYAYRNLDIPGRNKLEDVIRQRNIELPALTNPQDYLRYFDEFYNHGLRKNRIHLAHQWEIDAENN